MGENQFVGILTGSIPGDVTQLYYRIPRNDWEKSVGQDTCMQHCPSGIPTHYWELCHAFAIAYIHIGAHK